MSKNLLKTVFVGLMLMAVSLPVFAQEELPDSCYVRAPTGVDACDAALGGTETGTCSYVDDGDICGICCLLGTINYAVNWVFTFLIALTIIFVLLGAFQILTAAGSDEKISKGKNFIMFAAIGLALALLARAVPAIVKYVAGAPG